MTKALAGIIVFVGALLAICTATAPAAAGWITRDRLEQVFPPPLVVGEKDDKLPIWPILKQEAGSYDIIAYVFESNDFAPIPGFGGSPPDLLIAMAPDGSFLDVKVLAQHEPVFVDGLGPEPLVNFLSQYVGMSARHTIRVGRPNARSAGAAPTSVVDGVAMATASTRVINEEILASALAVARQKLGFGAANTLGLKVTAKPSGFKPMTWNELLAAGYVKDFKLLNRTVDAAYAGTSVATQTDGKPDAPFADTYVAYLNVPSIGRNILGDKLYTYLTSSLAPGDHAIMVLTAGPWTPIGDDFVFGAVPDRISVIQDRLSITARDLAIERGDQGMARMPAGQWTILKILDEAGFNPTKPWNLSLRVTRERGQILAEKINREFAEPYVLPVGLFDVRTPDAGPTWVDSWFARKWELLVLALMLTALVPVLVLQRGLVAAQKPFTLFRFGYLTLTLGFIGWYAQAQLSIVTLVGLARAASTTRDFSFLLYDPPSLVIWAFVLVTLVVWGRGTFCGWLCPFGALQELVAWPVKWLGLRLIEPPPRVDRGLRLVKYVVLAGILASAVLSAPTADALAEVEPFKTSITLYFVRFWPFVAYAVGLLLLNLFVYKGFCRYLCPLGASLAVVGRLRLFNWIPRRTECGTPCQLCKVKCRYGAIEPSGRIDYPECFQCMDCVTIIHDPAQCVPQILARKKGKILEPQLQPAEWTMRDVTTVPLPTRRKLLLGAAGTLAAATASIGTVCAFREAAAARGLVTLTRAGMAFQTTVALTIAGPDDRALEIAMAAAFASLRAVENASSVYRPDSDLSQLNRRGRIEAPHPHLMTLVTYALRLAAATDGRYDPTVQPLWDTWAAHAARGARPSDATLRDTLRTVDWRGVAIEDDGIRFDRPGMAVTLNSINQGYAADVVMATLAEHGIADAFVDTGEFGARGPNPAGRAWRLGVVAPRAPDMLAFTYDPFRRFAATSGDYKTFFSPDFRDHHIFDPTTGRSPPDWSSITVAAPSGLVADGLSTALFVLDRDSCRRLLFDHPDCTARFFGKDGAEVRVVGSQA